MPWVRAVARELHGRRLELRGGHVPDATHVTVPLGGNVTCTINNDDNAPALHLRKTVTNDNGGTALTRPGR